MSDDTTDDVDDELQRLRSKTTSGGGNRIDHDAASASTVVEDLVAALDRVDDGDLTKTLSVWDPEMSAVLDVLVADEDRLARVVDALAEDLGADVDAAAADRSDVLRLALRCGLAEADPALIEELREARREKAARDADRGL